MLHDHARVLEETVNHLRAYDIVRCARLIHVAVQALNDAHGEPTIDWDTNMPSVTAGVRRVLENPKETAEENHNAWMAYKAAEGWTWGPVKNATAKTHPCLVSFDALSPVDKAKDTIFLNIVREYFGL